MLFIVHPDEELVSESLIEQCLWEVHTVPFVGMSLGDVMSRCRFEDNEIVIDDDCIATVVYFRSGYVPENFHSEQCWHAREMIEQSRAVKCPDAGHHIVTTKTVQAAMAEPHNLRHLGLEEEKLVHLLSACAEQYPVCLASIQRACRFPSAFVLKRDREAGGNVTTGEKMVHKLSAMPIEDWAKFVLMAHISSPIHHVENVYNAQVHPLDVKCELGTYAVLITGDTDCNKYAGYGVRAMEHCLPAEGHSLEGTASVASVVLV